MGISATAVATAQDVSGECERSGSVLKGFNLYSQASIGQQRLSCLAFLHSNYDEEIGIDCVIDIFARKTERTLEFKNICHSSLAFAKDSQVLSIIVVNICLNKVIVHVFYEH